MPRRPAMGQAIRGPCAHVYCLRRSAHAFMIHYLHPWSHKWPLHPYLSKIPNPHPRPRKPVAGPQTPRSNRHSYSYPPIGPLSLAPPQAVNELPPPRSAGLATHRLRDIWTGPLGLTISVGRPRSTPVEFPRGPLLIGPRSCPIYNPC